MIHKFFTEVFVVVVWITGILCLAKYKNAEWAWLMETPYKKIVLPAIIISIIYVIEEYIRMIKSGIKNGTTGRNSSGR